MTDELIQEHLPRLQPLLDKWTKSKRLPSSLLIVGPAGVGKKEIALHLCAWMECEQNPLNAQASLFGGKSEGDAPCGNCAACTRKENVDLIHFSGKETLKVDELRPVFATQGFGAHDGQYKIVFVENAERLTPQASNAMLKILEEPPPNWIFLLTAQDSRLLLPTIVSRCQRIRLRPLSADRLDALLEANGIPKSRRRVVVGLGQGSLARAMEFASDENWEKRKLIFDFIEAPHENFSPLLDWAASDAESLSSAIDQMESVTHDLIQNSETQSFQNQDGVAVLKRHLARIQRRFPQPERARAFFVERFDDLSSARKKIPLPLNRKLLTQTLLVPWLEI